MKNDGPDTVLRDDTSYEENPETLALLEILALGTRQVEAGKIKPVSAVVKRLRERAVGD
jgi:hypothetical protein